MIGPVQHNTLLVPDRKESLDMIPRFSCGAVCRILVVVVAAVLLVSANHLTDRMTGQRIY